MWLKSIKIITIFTSYVYTTSLQWSEIKSLCASNGICCPESECTIPEDEDWRLDTDMDVGTLIVHGKLSWDINTPNIELRYSISYLINIF